MLECYLIIATMFSVMLLGATVLFAAIDITLGRYFEAKDEVKLGFVAAVCAWLWPITLTVALVFIFSLPFIPDSKLPGIYEKIKGIKDKLFG